MLKGDLATTPLPEVLRTLAAAASTGCVRVRVSTGEAKVFLRQGRVYAVLLPDRRPQLGPRLVSSGDLDPASLAEAYDAQRTELQGWRLGELLVHLGYVEQDVVEQAVGEQLREAAFELTLWTAGTWRFRPDERTREDVAPAVDVETLLADLSSYAVSWEALRPRVHGPDAVPVLSAAGTSPETLSLDGDAWSLLCTVDGASSLSQLAGSSGLSLLEAAQVVVALVDAGLVEVDSADAEVAETAPALSLVPALDEPEPDVVAGDGPVAIASRLAEALRDLGPMPVLAPYPLPTPAEPADEPQPAQAADVGLASTVLEGEALSRSLASSLDDQSVADSISSASESLAVTLGDLSEPFDPFAVSTTSLAPAPLPPLDDREARRRARDAQELAERHAELEAERAAEHAREMQLARQTMAEPDVVGLSDEDRRAAAEMQAAAFAELRAASTVTPRADVAPPVGPEPVDTLSEPAPEPDDASPVSPRGADTAALLRELSSLGLEDEPDAVPQQRTPAPPVVRPLASVASKKRKGLFGRA